MKNLAFEIVNNNNLGHYDIIELVTELLQYTSRIIIIFKFLKSQNFK